MSRLIDADKLHYIRKWFEDSGKSEVVVFAKEIDKAPTIKAIPIEWLYQKRTLYLENKCYMSLMVINEILNWWEEENGEKTV